MDASSVRKLLGVFAPFAVATAMLAGCTFLISFDAEPGLDEGGATFDAAPTLDVSETADSKPVVDARIDSSTGPDARDALANPAACKGKPDGLYCGGDQVTWPPPGTKDDLITCAKGVVSSVRACTAGDGCLRLGNGYPDECDACSLKADGYYCGRDMPGWSSSNANMRVRCQGHAEVGLLQCATTCVSNGAAAACK